MQNKTVIEDFKLALAPMVKPTIIVLTGEDNAKAVIFPAYRQHADIVGGEIALKGESLRLEGSWGTDKKTGKPQFFVDKVTNNKLIIEERDAVLNETRRAPQPSVSPTEGYMARYDINPAVDFIEGGLSSKNNKLILKSQPRENQKQYYTDGDYFWFDDSTGKCPTSF